MIGGVGTKLKAVLKHNRWILGVGMEVGWFEQAKVEINSFFNF